MSSVSSVKINGKIFLKYTLTEGITYFNPSFIAVSSKTAERKLRLVLDILLKSNILPESILQNAEREYKALVNDHFVVEQIKLYRKKTTRLDDFW